MTGHTYLAAYALRNLQSNHPLEIMRLGGSRFMRIELYGANLHVGGAVNTTASLVDGVLAGMEAGQYPWVESLEIVVSPSVHRAMSKMSGGDLASNVVFKIRYDGSLSSLARFAGSARDVRYVFFGPDYLWSRARVNVLGFADGTVIPANAYSSEGQMSLRSDRDMIRNIKKSIKRLLLRKYDGFVVQTTAMANSLESHFPDKSVTLVPNVLSPAFLDAQLRERCDLPDRQIGEVRLAFPAKGYPHKNHVLLTKVAREFQMLTGRKLRFVVTLEPSEYFDVFKSDDFGIINVGPLPSKKIPSLLEQTDGLFFPSLNETFSSAPLEAAFMKRPIIASDLPYARESLDGIATLFDPHDPSLAAHAIALVEEGLAAGHSQLHATMSAAYRWSLIHANPESAASALMNSLKTFAK